MGSFALLTGHTSFEQIFASLHYGSYISNVLGILSTIVVVIIALVENSRMPFDDPRTHLELTMIHEVMILDYSGFDLALIMYGTQLKFAMYGALIANFFMGPFSIVPALLIFFVAQLLFAISVGVIESFASRFRMNHNPQFIYTLSSITLLIFFGVLIALGKII
jgi:formate hydrogenlyase subunit 4